MLVTLFKCAV